MTIVKTIHQHDQGFHKQHIYSSQLDIFMIEIVGIFFFGTFILYQTKSLSH